jgi:hypothetical protein
MIVKVHLLAFGKPDEIRQVEIPDNTPKVEILEAVFQWGQNELQSQQHPSVSAADVIEHDGKYFRVDAVGFSEMSVAQFANYKGMNRIDRQFYGDYGS